MVYTCEVSPDILVQLKERRNALVAQRHNIGRLEFQNRYQLSDINIQMYGGGFERGQVEQSHPCYKKT